jgi:hypothetical protein
MRIGREGQLPCPKTLVDTRSAAQAAKASTGLVIFSM